MKRVLIVDDEPVMRELMIAMLRKANYDVVGQAPDVATALVEYQEKKPDIVLLDIALRQGSGLDVLRQLRASDSRATVIMVSGEIFVEQVTQAQQLGADGFVAKPFNIERLVRALDRAQVQRAAGTRPNA